MKSEEAMWVSCYVSYTTDPDDLLSHTIWPFVQQIFEDHSVQQFFFIRYFDERGPHIRLRLLPTVTTLHQDIEQQVQASFPRVDFVNYIPELERYGGPHGVVIAEKLFEASSTAILRILDNSPVRNYSYKLATAMQLHIGMLQAFGLTRQEMVSLFAHITKSIQEETAYLFEQAFITQRATIVSPLRNLWNTCENNNQFADEWFRDWREAMRSTANDLMSAINASRLLLPQSPYHKNSLWHLYESYIHMTNNRLGIKYADELFIAYLLQSCFSSE